MDLQTKIISVSLTIFVISLLFIGIVYFASAKQVIEINSFNQLEAVAQSIDNTIVNSIAEQEHKIELIATQSGLSNEELKEMVAIDTSFYELFTIDSNGIIIASSDEANIGLNESNEIYFVNAKNQSYVQEAYYSPTTKKNSYTVSTPFHEMVLVGRINLDYLNRFINIKTSLGDTGEVLLAYKDDSENIVYFSQRRFSDKTIEVLTKEQVINRPIYYAVMGNEGAFTNLKDYRNVEVISVTNFIEKINVSMVTKRDVSEALAPLIRIRNLVLLITIIIILLITGIILIVTRNISREISSITQDLDRITKGELDIQLKKSQTFEVQSLTDSLNRILASLKLAILRTGLSKEELGIGEAVKAKMAAENKFKQLYETSNDAIMTLEPPTWNFTSGNPATIKMFNVKDEKLFTTLGPGDLSPEKQPDGQSSTVKAKKMIEKAMKEGSSMFEWTHKKYKGENFLAMVLLSRVEESGKTYLRATIRDITEVKHKSAQLERFVRMAEGRELEMIQLKKRIKKLESQGKR